MDFASLGIRLNTSEVKAGTADLEKLTAVGEKAEKAIDDLGTAGKTTGASLGETGKATKAAERSIDDYIKKLELMNKSQLNAATSAKLIDLSARGASNSQLNAAKSALDASDAKRTSAAIDGQVLKLQTVAAMAGKSARETKLYELAVQGASKAQLAAADSAIRMNEANERGVLIGQRLRVGLIAAAAAAATLATTTIASNIKLLDSLDDMAEKTGLSVEKLSELRYAGEVSGTSVEALGGGISRLSRLMAQAAGGNKEATATFRALGVEVKNTDGTLRSSDDVLGDLSNRFAGYEDGAAKAALAQRVFGKSGEDMLPFLNLGAAGVARLAKEAKDLGAIYSGDVAKAAADFNDNLTKVRIASEAAAISITGGLIKTLANLSTEFVEAKKNGGLFAAGMESYFAGVKAFWNGTMFSGESAGKSTEQIQKYVNAMASAAAAGGRGFVNPRVAAPIVPEERRTPRGKADNSAEQEAKARLAAEVDAIRNARELISNTIANSDKLLEAQRSAALLDERAYYAAKAALIRASNTAAQDALEKEIARLEQERFAGKTAGKDQIDNDKKIADARTKLTKARADGATQLQVLSLQESTSAKRIADDYDRAKESAKGYLDTIARGYKREISGVGQGDQARERLAALGAIDDRRQQQEAQLDGELRRKEINETLHAQYIEVVRDTYAKEVQLYQQRTAALDTLQTNWVNGATDALTNYYKQSQRTADMVQSAFTSAFGGLEDALVSFVTTGKADFKTLANSIIADIARIAIKQQITGPLAGLLSGLLGGGGSTAGFGSGAIAIGGSLIGQRAIGGPVSAGSLYQINEKGIGETFVTAGKQYLVPASDGEIKAGGGGPPIVVHQNFTVGDVATVSMVRDAVKGSEARISGALSRSQSYGGRFSS